jgi:hypothetical protein
MMMAAQAGGCTAKPAAGRAVPGAWAVTTAMRGMGVRSAAVAIT